MLHTFKNEVIRLWPLLVGILMAVIILGDWKQLAVQTYMLSMIGLVIVAAHIARKSLFPYVDMSALVIAASRRAIGAAIVFASMIALLCTIILATASLSHAETMLDRAAPYLPQVSRTIDTHWPALAIREAIPAQIEQESRWNPRARLHTDREDGYGFAQITVTSRFNNFKNGLPELRGWDWRSNPYSVAHQLTYLVLTDRSNYASMSRLFPAPLDRMAAALVSYNAGPGTVLQRRAAALASGRPADRWFGGLDAVRLGYEQRLLYGRNLGDMRNDYPRLVLQVRAPKYRGRV